MKFTQGIKATLRDSDFWAHVIIAALWGVGCLALSITW